MLVKELKRLLEVMPDTYRIAFTIDVSDNVPTLVEIDPEDFFINDQFGYVEIDASLSDDTLEELEDALLEVEGRDEGILIYTSNDRYKSLEQKMLERGMSVVSN